MDISIKKCIKEINKNHNVDEFLPKYVKGSMHYNKSYACYRLALEYFMFYETVSEELASAASSANDTLAVLNGIIREFFEKNPGDSECKDMAGRLLVLREEVKDQVQVLAAYLDCFIIYEYIFNRIQYRFDEMGEMPDDNEFIQKVISYVFASEDNTVVNENIRFMIEQLPMAMLLNPARTAPYRKDSPTGASPPASTPSGNNSPYRVSVSHGQKKYTP